METKNNNIVINEANLNDYIDLKEICGNLIIEINTTLPNLRFCDGSITVEKNTKLNVPKLFETSGYIMLFNDAIIFAPKLHYTLGLLM